MQSYASCIEVPALDRSQSGEFFYTIHDLPKDERPRQKLLSRGPEALSLKELLAVILNTGTTREDVVEMTNRIMREYGEKNVLFERNPLSLSEELNIPLGKACQIVATGELGRRCFDKSASGFTTVHNASDAYTYLQDMKSLTKEHLRGLYLNSHHKVIRSEIISIGTVNSNLIHPREVFRPALEANAAALILAHNHPSGELAPSSEDIEITQRIVEAGKLIGISVLDHIIITAQGYLSLINTNNVQ